MTPDTIRLLLSLLDQVVLRGSEPNIEELATALALARRELEAQLLPEGPNAQQGQASSEEEV